IRFAKEGYDVCLNDIQKDKLQDVLASLPAGDHISFAGNFADKETISNGEKLIAEKWSRLDVLVNCAGLFEKTDPVSMNIDQWRKVFDVMVNGCLLVTQLALKFIKENGRLIHITSIHGTRAEHAASSYSMAKAAINQFCRSMAV